MSKFKIMPTSNSNVFFLWFKTEKNRIPSFPRKAMVNIYILKRLKQWLRSVEGIQWYKRFQIDFSGTISKAMSKQGKIKKVSSALHSISIKTEVMQQIEINICNLPKVNDLKHLVIYIDYFSKWSEAKPIKDKSVSTIAQFLYEVICRHGCTKI